MPILPNAKHERFAQEVAQGRSASEAFVIAGYKAHDGNAARLRGNERVRARIEELQQAGAKQAEVTIERVIKGFADIAFSSDEKTSSRLVALDRLGKHLGMFKEQVEHTVQYDLSALSDDELHDLRSTLQRIVTPAGSRH